MSGGAYGLSNFGPTDIEDVLVTGNSRGISLVNGGAVFNLRDSVVTENAMEGGDGWGYGLHARADELVVENVDVRDNSERIARVPSSISSMSTSRTTRRPVRLAA